MSDVLYLIGWKIRLTWRLYTRHAIASLETVLFVLAFIAWLVLGSWLLYHVAQRALFGNWMPRTLVFCDLFTLIFIPWLFIPLAGYRLNESYDLRRLRIYPLAPWKIWLSNLLGSFTDIVVLLPLAGFIAVFLGTSPAPAQIPVGILLIVALLFILVLSWITLLNLIYVLLPRLNLVSVLMFIIAAVLVWAMLLNLGLVRHPAETFNFFVLFRPAGIEVFRPYPQGQIAIALDCYMDGRWEEFKVSLMQFGLWTAGVLVLNYLLVAVLWESDEKAAGGGKIAEGRDLPTVMLNGLEEALAPIFGSRAIAVYKKDMLEFAARSPYFLLYKFLPGTIAPVIILMAMRWNLEHYVRFSYWPELGPTVRNITFAVVLFIVIGQGLLFSGNQFGFESENARTLFTLPTHRRHILMGKNIFLGGLYMIDALVLSLLVLLYYPYTYIFFATFSLMITLFILILSIGNFTSAIWPYWMPLDRPSFTLRGTLILSLVNAGALIALALAFAPALAMVALPIYLGNNLLAYLLMPVAVAYGILFHRLTFDPAVGLLESNEFLVLRRVADNEQF